MASTKARIEHELFVRTFMPANPPAEVMAQLVPLMRDVTFERGETIYEAGRPATRVFFVSSGAVELRHPRSQVWTFREGSLIGIVDASLGREHSRTATAIEDTQLIVLDYNQYLDVIEDNFEYGKALLLGGAVRQHEFALERGGDVFAHVSERRPALGSDVRLDEPLSALDRLFVLRATPMFRSAPVQALASLARLAVQARFEPGDVLFSHGEIIKQLHVLVDGRVRLSLEHPQLEIHFEPTRVLGGLAALGYNRRFYDAVAVKPAVTLMIQKEDLFDLMEDHFGVARALFAQISSERARVLDRREPQREVPSLSSEAESD